MIVRTAVRGTVGSPTAGCSLLLIVVMVMKGATQEKMPDILLLATHIK
jgi:hypothetical protein